MAMFTEDELKAKVQDGYMVESVEEMTEGYRKSLIVQLTVQADTELMSAPSYWRAAQHAPSTNTQVSAHAIIQDELAHSNIAYRLLEDLGVSKAKLSELLQYPRSRRSMRGIIRHEPGHRTHFHLRFKAEPKGDGPNA